jgi:DNA-binding MarR family transcriptional regulator
MPQAYFSGQSNVVGAMSLAIADRLRDATEEAAGQAGTLPAALVALHEFAGGKPIEFLAGALRVTHSRAVRVVDRLEAGGLARRTAAPADGRAVQVELTAAGRRAALRVAAARARVIEAALGDLSPAERAQLAGLAARVLGALARTRRDARQICRMCDVEACGHHEGRCPVTNAVDAAEARRAA